MKKISIEYAHIYTHNKISEEQDFSVKVLNEIFASNNISKHDVVLTVMIDDYSFPDPEFNYSLFVDYLESYNLKPDIVIRESQLIPICDQVIILIENEVLRFELIDYIKQKKKYPCSLFIASWYLLRAGCITSSLFENSFIAEKLINILPESFNPFEEKAFEIISYTRFAEKITDIENKYFNGRDL